MPKRAGFSLAETLLALTLLLVALTCVLALLSALRSSFARTASAADAAERLRLILDSLARDLRATGAGVLTDGPSARTDEAVEGAWPTAVVARADLDGFDPVASLDPEAWIRGVLPSTRTANDEVFAFALRTDRVSAGGDLAFEADLWSDLQVETAGGEPVAGRDGVVEPLTLTRILDASQQSLETGAVFYRASVSNNPGSWGTGRAVVWQPITDGVVRLSFRYLDERGMEIAAPGGAESGREARVRIHQIEARVVVIGALVTPGGAAQAAGGDSGRPGVTSAEGWARVSLRNAGRGDVP